MSADAADDLALEQKREEIREAVRRWRAADERLGAISSNEVNGHPVPAEVQERFVVVRTERDAAEEHLRTLYAAFLRTDPDFATRSDAIGEQISAGPPWDDVFSPSDLLRESDGLAT